MDCFKQLHFKTYLMFYKGSRETGSCIIMISLCRCDEQAWEADTTAPMVGSVWRFGGQRTPAVSESS